MALRSKQLVWMRRLWFPWGLIIALYCGYLVLARTGLIFAATPALVTPVWPLSGIVLGMLLRLRLRFWYIVWLADFTVGVWLHIPPLVAAGIATGTTVEAFLGAFLLQRFAGYQPTLTRLREVLAMIGATALVAIPIGASISTLSLLLGNRIEVDRISEVWLIWYVGDVMGILTITPMILTWVAPLPRPFKIAKVIEVTATWLVLIAIATFVFRSQLDYVFLLFPILIWAALRFGPRGAATFILSVCFLAIWYTARGIGPFVESTVTRNLVFVQIFLGVLSIVTLMLTALLAEREQRTNVQEFFAAFSALLEPNIAEDELLSQTANLVTRTFADWCFIDMIAPDNYRLKRVGLSCFDDAQLSNVCAILSDPPEMQIGQHPLVDRMIVDGSSLIVSTIDTETLHLLNDNIAELKALRLRSLMAVPLVTNAGILGYMVMITARRIWRYGADDLIFAQTLAGRLADFISNARQQNVSREQQKFEALGRLAGNIAHDFNNMLAVISSSAELGIISSTQMPVREELQNILTTTQRAQRLTRRILSFARRQPYLAQPTHVNQLITDLHPMMQRLINPMIEVQFELTAKDDVVELDREQFEQVLANLIANARDAMPNGGTLTIATRNVTNQEYTRLSDASMNGAALQVIVRDTGVGIDSETQKRIFEPFFTTKPEGQGTGFGLAMSYTFMRQTGGSITVNSQPQHGATFTLTFPLTTTMPVAASHSAVANA